MARKSRAIGEEAKMDLDEYVRLQNIELYRKLLAESPAGHARQMVLLKLLAEETAKEAVKPRKSN